MQRIIEIIFQFFSALSPLVLFLLVVVFGMYVYWRGSMETRKNRSSIFDIFLISIFIGLVISRVAYVISNGDQFSGYIWYWLPYERYGEEVYWFRLLPWRYLNIFDGGINIFVMFVGYLLMASAWSTSFKKWRWSQTFPTIFFSGESMLASSFILLGLSNSNVHWLYQGAILLVFPVISYALIRYVNKIENAGKEKKIYLICNLLLILLASAVIAYIYLFGDVDLYEKIALVIFTLWVGIGLIYFTKDSRRTSITIEKVSSVHGVDINQPFKFPK